MDLIFWMEYQFCKMARLLAFPICISNLKFEDAKFYIIDQISMYFT